MLRVISRGVRSVDLIGGGGIPQSEHIRQRLQTILRSLVETLVRSQHLLLLAEVEDSESATWMGGLRHLVIG